MKFNLLNFIWSRNNLPNSEEKSRQSIWKSHENTFKGQRSLISNTKQSGLFKVSSLINFLLKTES